MRPSPLQLESYMFTRIHLDACDDPKCLEAENVGQFHVNSQCQEHNDDPSRWMVTLHLSIGQADGKECPSYSLDMEAVGFFHVTDDFPAEKRTPMVKANAPAVLFGAMREMVANITARGPYPRMDLPTVTFVDEVMPGLEQ